MLQVVRCALALLCTALVYAQISNNSVTVTATQAPAGQPDQASFAVSVSSGLDKNLSDIVSALQSAGITTSDFTGVSFPQVPSVLSAAPTQPPAPQMQWDFQLNVPIAKVKDMTAALAALAQSLPQNSSGLSLTFSIQGTLTSPQPASGCKLSDLLASARTQAQQLAGAAPGLTVGLIQAITTSAPDPCSLTVRFALGTVLMPSQPYSITITASRSPSVQPDEISIGLNATSNVNSGLDDVTSALQQAGVSGATFAGVSTVTFYQAAPAKAQPQLQWSFSLTAPLAKIKDTFGALISGQQALAKASPPINLSFYGGSTTVSPQLAASQSCPNADLFKDAQTGAQQVAAAAGASAGPLLSIGRGNPSPTAQWLSSTIYDPYDPVAGYASFLLGAPGFAPNCSLTVSFVLVQ